MSAVKTNASPATLRRLRIAIFLIAALIRFAYGASVRGTALDRFHEWDQSDMATYIEQSRRIAEGDWLGRDPYHPYHLWQRFAPVERWEAWYPPRSFHQAPGYSYFLAAHRVLFGERFFGVARLIQALMGAGTALLVFELARRLSATSAASLGAQGNRALGAATLAGLIAAFYGPMIQIEAQALRDGPAIFFALLATLPLAKADEISSGPARRFRAWLAAAGFGLGVTTLFHETGQVLMLAAGLGVIFLAWRAKPATDSAVEPILKRVTMAAVAFGAGAALALSPLVIRNLAVGSPPMAISSRPMVVFAMSNHAAAPDGGSSWGFVGEGFVELMDGAQRSFGRLAIGVAKSYKGDIGRALGGWGRRITAQAMNFEAPDNAAYSFFRERNFILKPTPSFWLVFAPGLAGVALALGLAWRHRATSRSALPVQLALVVLALAGALSLVHALGRLRLMWVPFLTVFAALFFSEMSQRLRVGRLSKGDKTSVPPSPSSYESFAVVALPWIIFVLAAGLQMFGQWLNAPDRPRAADYAIAGVLSSKAGDWETAVADYQRAKELGVDSIDIDRALGVALFRCGRKEEAVRLLEQAEEKARGMGLPSFAEELARLRRGENPKQSGN